MKGKQETKLEKFLNSTLFYSGELFGSLLVSDSFLKGIRWDSIPFTVRFYNVLKKTELKTLLDLLNCDFNKLYMMKNCGVKSIQDARIIIYEYLQNIFTDDNFDQLFNCDSLRKKNIIQETIYIPFLNKKINDLDGNLTQLKKIPLSQIILPTRLQKYIEFNSKIQTVGDLLEIESTSLIKEKNIGRKSITEGQSIIENLILNPNEIAVFQHKEIHIIDLVEKFLDNLDERSKSIFLMRWSSETIESLEDIGKTLDLTRERIRQIISNKLNKLAIKFRLNRGLYLEYFLKILLQNLTTIRFEQLIDQNFSTCRYSEKVVLGILSEIFKEVPFEGLTPKSFNQYLMRNSPKNSRFAFFYNELTKLKIPFGKITPIKLFEMMKIASIQDRLILLYTIINSSQYLFVKKNNDTFFIIRQGTLGEVTNDILEGADSPKAVDEILTIMREYYQKDSKYFSLPAVISNLKSNTDFIQLDRYTFGLEKHFGYPKDEWSEICSELKKYMRVIKRQTNAAELYKNVKGKYPKIRSKYELVYILRNDEEIIDLGFFNYCLEELGYDERLKVTDAIKDLFNTEPFPKHFTEIQHIISKQRFIRIEGIHSILKTQSFLINYKGGFFGIRSLSEKNLEFLARNETYISKIITYEIFPETSLKKIHELFNSFDNYEEIIKITVAKSNKLHLYEDFESKSTFIISKDWSPVKITHCLLFNLNRPIFLDELNWIFNDIGIQLEPNYKYKIISHKNITLNGNKISYFSINIDKKDIIEIADICYGMLSTNNEPSLVEEICNYINTDYIEITNQELIYILENDDRFLLVDNQLIMVHG